MKGEEEEEEEEEGKKVLFGRSFARAATVMQQGQSDFSHLTRMEEEKAEEEASALSPPSLPTDHSGREGGREEMRQSGERSLRIFPLSSPPCSLPPSLPSTEKRRGREEESRQGWWWRRLYYYSR